MSQQPRLDLPGYLYHAIVRGINRERIFKDSCDYLEFIRRFKEILDDEEGVCFGWTIIPWDAR